MILTKISNRNKVSTANIREELSNPTISSTQGTKDLIIDVKLYLQVSTAYIMCKSITSHIVNHWLTVVLTKGLIVRMLLS